MKAPALCNNCGLIFPCNFFEFENCTNVTLSNCDGGKCPNCGGKSRILDGVYNFIDNTIELLKGPDRTITELQRLSEILQQARSQKASVDEVTEKIRQELPVFSKLNNFLPKTRSELYAFISIIISIVTILINQAGSKEAPKIEINQVINNIYQNQVQVSEHKAVNRPPRIIKPNKTKVGRNERCPCGSELKYKKCCLRK